MTQATRVFSTPRTASSLFRRLSDRALDPRDVIADLLEELLIDDPQQVAQTIIDRLRDAGFKIVPTTREDRS